MQPSKTTTCIVYIDSLNTYIWGCPTKAHPRQWNQKQWTILQNAIKAIQMVSILNKLTTYHYFYIPKTNPILYRKLMFCVSGFLPKRIKHKKKS
jgi:hypothetical protein